MHTDLKRVMSMFGRSPLVLSPKLRQARSENILAAYNLAYTIIKEKGPITQRALYEETQKEFHPPPHDHHMQPTENMATHKTKGIHIVTLPPPPPHPDHLIKSYRFLKDVLREAYKEYRTITKLSKNTWARLHGLPPAPRVPEPPRGHKYDKGESNFVWITQEKYEEIRQQALAEGRNHDPPRRPEKAAKPGN
jgi:hypothetical protein